MNDTSGLFDLSGKTALVTGASSGLGRRAAQALVASGATVVGLARRSETLQALKEDLGKGFEPVVADLGGGADFAEISERASEPFGAPDIVVHAAGVNLREPVDVVDQESWDATIHLNLTVPFFLSRALVDPMARKGWGRVITFASLQTYRAFPNSIPYGASKGGIAQLTRAMAEAWSAKGVMVNGIGPGFFPTELTQPVFDDPQKSKKNAEQTCIGRNGKVEDIDGPLVFLCSPASDYVTGQILMVDGGFSAK
jgi:NAD(P)-dependent dehydrogenase (short-subunit alcohol dehydrogenase family)